MDSDWQIFMAVGMALSLSGVAWFPRVVMGIAFLGAALVLKNGWLS